MHDVTDHLKQLGNQNTEYVYQNPSSSMLETFPNRFPERDYEIVHETDEYSSLCPKTKQPDFARINITYVADKDCIESKSLKLYLFAYRQVGAFMETICNQILSDLVQACSPRKMTVRASFAGRGGIRTTVVASHEG